MKKWTIYYKKKTGNQLRKFGKNHKNTGKMIGLEKILKENKERGGKWKDRGSGTAA